MVKINRTPEIGSTIVERQNRPEAIQQLLAQRQLYQDVKRIDAFRFWVAFVLAAIGFMLLLWQNSATEVARALAGLWLFLDLVLFRRLARGWQGRAASIQEIFDTEVLSLPWNKVLVGQPPIHEHIVEAARRFQKRGDITLLKDWYPDVSDLPLPLARLVCQRTNIVWDGQLRQRYSVIMLAFVALLAGATIIYAMFTGVTILDYLLIFLPSLPILILGAEVVNGQQAAVKQLDKLQALAHSFWIESLSGGISNKRSIEQSRALQDCIFINRKQNPLVPELVYHYLRGAYETDSWESADRLAKEAKQAIRL